MADLSSTIIRGNLRTIGDTTASHIKAENGANIKLYDSTNYSAGSVSDNVYTPVKWSFNGVASGLSLQDGDTFTIKIPTITGNDYGIFLSVDGGTTYYPIASSGTSRLTSQYSVGTYLTVIFEESGSVESIFPVAGGSARVTVTGGCFRVSNYYDSGNYGAIQITYSDLKTLINNSQLVPGQLYRMTDYVTTVNTTNEPEAQSVRHQFDLIIRALSSNELDENVSAVQHSGDTYFNTCKLSSWNIKYDIDNNTDKYSWADSTNGKGVIYYMKDEWNNECPYDFKNVQFKRYKISSV